MGKQGAQGVYTYLYVRPTELETLRQLRIASLVRGPSRPLLPPIPRRSELRAVRPADPAGSWRLCPRRQRPTPCHTLLGARDHKQPPLLGTTPSPPRSEQEPEAWGAASVLGAHRRRLPCWCVCRSRAWTDAPLCSAQVCPQLVRALSLSRSVFEIELSGAPPLRRTALCSLPLLSIV